MANRTIPDVQRVERRAERELQPQQRRLERRLDVRRCSQGFQVVLGFLGPMFFWALDTRSLGGFYPCVLILTQSRHRAFSFLFFFDIIFIDKFEKSAGIPSDCLSRIVSVTRMLAATAYSRVLLARSFQRNLVRFAGRLKGFKSNTALRVIG